MFKRFGNRVAAATAAAVLSPRVGQGHRRISRSRWTHSSSNGIAGLETTSTKETQTSLSSSSVSAAEVEKFVKLSNEWWDPMGPFKYLHTMNGPRIRFVREILADLARLAPQGDRFNKPESKNGGSSRRGRAWIEGLAAVDVGCGGGLAAEALARLGMRVLGIDAARENIDMARAHAPRDLDNLRYAQTTAEELVAEQRQKHGAAADSLFDAVVSLEVIEHVADPVPFCRSLVELAKPGGVVVVSTMNRTPLSFVVDVVLPEYLLGSVPRGTHDHSRFVPPDELRQIFRSLGAELLDTQGLILDPFSNTCHLAPADFGLLRNAGVQANYISAFRKSK
ncbi:Hexaprenyldihydroxybenzoate methyltransferase, mitochondrial [Coemansia sp. RSA 2049]|nr:Hexaprenyldihydroxybenzoate methyltransferase, mitochondrial [Coemansia sp. RSA 2049]